MRSNRYLTRGLAAAALVLGSGIAHAALTAYTNPGSFAAATTLAASDSFSGLPNDNVTSPATRAAGAYQYSVSAPGGLFGSGPDADRWLSSKLSGDRITFNAFSGGVQAIGGLFFGSDFNDDFLPGQTVTLTALDSLGATSVQTLSNATTTSFAGFASTGTLVSLAVDIGARSAFVSVNDLVLAQAQVAAIPEPETSALLLAGLGALAARVRQRASRRVASNRP